MFTFLQCSLTSLGRLLPWKMVSRRCCKTRCWVCRPCNIPCGRCLIDGVQNLQIAKVNQLAMGQNPGALVNPRIAGKGMFISPVTNRFQNHPQIYIVPHTSWHSCPPGSPPKRVDLFVIFCSKMRCPRLISGTCRLSWCKHKKGYSKRNLTRCNHSPNRSRRVIFASRCSFSDWVSWWPTGQVCGPLRGAGWYWYIRYLVWAVVKQMTKEMTKGSLGPRLEHVGTLNDMHEMCCCPWLQRHTPTSPKMVLATPGVRWIEVGESVLFDQPSHVPGCFFFQCGSKCEWKTTVIGPIQLSMGPERIKGLGTNRQTAYFVFSPSQGFQNNDEYSAGSRDSTATDIHDGEATGGETYGIRRLSRFKYMGVSENEAYHPKSHWNNDIDDEPNNQCI